MLEENKQLYKEVADNVIPDWEKINKNELIRLASKCENKRLKDGYFSAIMLKYWNKIDSYYYKCRLVTTPEDIHQWLSDAILYAIERTPWEDPSMNIYEDPNGPDKVINRIVESTRLTFYQQLNRYKRKINSNLMSLDSLSDDYKDLFSPIYRDNYDFEVHEFIIKSFNKQDYLLSFIIDAIIYEDVFKGGIEIRKVIHHLKRLDDTFAKNFAERYNLDYEKVKESLQYVVKLSPLMLRKKIHYNLIKLKEELKEG